MGSEHNKTDLTVHLMTPISRPIWLSGQAGDPIFDQKLDKIWQILRPTHLWAELFGLITSSCLQSLQQVFSNPTWNRPNPTNKQVYTCTMHPCQQSCLLGNLVLCCLLCLGEGSRSKTWMQMLTWMCRRVNPSDLPQTWIQLARSSRPKKW